MLTDSRRYIVRPIEKRFQVFDTKTRLVIVTYEVEMQAIRQARHMNELVEEHFRA